MLRPLGKLVVVVEKKQENKTASGIILQDPSINGSSSGIVVAVGPDATLVSVGDVVSCLWSKGTVVRDQGQQYVILNQDDIVAVIEE